MSRRASLIQLFIPLSVNPEYSAATLPKLERKESNSFPYAPYDSITRGTNKAWSARATGSYDSCFRFSRREAADKGLRVEAACMLYDVAQDEPRTHPGTEPDVMLCWM